MGLFLNKETVKYLKRGLGRFNSLLLAALLCLSLVNMGTLFWVNNSWALVLDNDPTSMVNLAAFFDGGGSDAKCAELDDDNDGLVPVAGGVLVRGNGDRDDHKEEPFTIPLHVADAVVPLFYLFSAKAAYRCMAVSYKDFGHLKLMPEADYNIYAVPNTFVADKKVARVLRAAFGILKLRSRVEDSMSFPQINHTVFT